MNLLSDFLIVLVAILQTAFLIIEMFFWQAPAITKRFGFTKEFAKASAALAKNQGLYNGFLAAGLVWGVVESDPFYAFRIKLFFISCVLIAGVYGALTANRRILVSQALPALIALIALFAAR